MSIADRLNANLLALMGRLSFNEVARRAGVAPRSLKLAEGTRVGTLVKVAGALGCEVSELVREVG